RGNGHGPAGDVWQEQVGQGEVAEMVGAEVKGWLLSAGAADSNHPFTSAMWGQMGPENPTMCQEKRERSFQTFLCSPAGRDHAGNSFEKMIYQWGQISIHDNLSPLVFDG
ncbi:MAG TPA: hypothetical protein VKB35_12985, partial [Ktedonobacteraceae bacterium]|nr:hypothetical protein [Ktedonobacteraceae bacterium]